MNSNLSINSVKSERAILVGVVLPEKADEFDNLVELSSLAKTAGAIIVGSIIQKRHKIDPAYYIGRGKVEELADLVSQKAAELVIFDNDLTPGQIRNLENAIRCRVIDRSELILDIFATHARTKQARLQVELAQLQYTYPRLRHMWTHLERIVGAAGGKAAGTVGGIGTRGPGEKQIEVDRRIVRRRIDILKRELKEIDSRKLREVATRSDQFTICLVGYTNAGKSTLMKALTGADVYIEDKLFATLDTRTRQWNLGEGKIALLSDTVGFVRDLPHHLIASFKATLEEAVHADLLIHVVDASNPKAEFQIRTVKSVLKDIGCDNKNILTVFNKIDLVDRDSLDSTLNILRQYEPEGIPISAAKGIGLDLLKERVSTLYTKPSIYLKLSVDIASGRCITFLRTHAKIHSIDYIDSRALITLTISSKVLGQLRKYKEAFKIEETSDNQVYELLGKTN